MNEWIKITERSPILGEHVLFVCDHYTRCGYYHVENIFFDCLWGHGRKATYWMSFPKPPSKDDNTKL